MSALGIVYDVHKVIYSPRAPLTAINALSTAASPSVEPVPISSLPRPPQINLKHLRAERYTHKGMSRALLRGRNASTQRRYGNLQLPKVYKLICVPENGLEGAPLMPKKTAHLYMELESRNMIVDVTFNEGSLCLCGDERLIRIVPMGDERLQHR